MLEDVIKFDYIPDVFSYTRLDFLYAGDGLVASTDPVWLQGEFVTLTGLFDNMGLHTDVRKAVGMIFCHCRAGGIQSEASYEQHTTG